MDAALHTILAWGPLPRGKGPVILILGGFFVLVVSMAWVLLAARRARKREAAEAARRHGLPPVASDEFVIPAHPRDPDAKRDDERGRGGKTRSARRREEGRVSPR